MNTTPSSVEELARLGAEIHFIIERVSYLRQHPDAKPGQPFVMDDDAAYATVVMLGAISDLLLDVGERDAPGAGALEVELTSDGMEIRVRVSRNPDVTRPGYQLIRSLSDSVSLVANAQRLVIRMSGRSIQNGFPTASRTNCPVVIAR